MSAVDIHRDDELRELYRELIIDHARTPRHFGKLATATHSASGINPLCGDKLWLYLHLDDDARIVDAAFEGSGCAISVASASLLIEAVIGTQADAALEYCAALTAQLSGDEATSAAYKDPGKLRALFGVREFPARVKCATLAWHALEAALRKQATPASTE